MGLVKFGAGIVQISGSIAGTVHARNRFGNYIRPRTKPVNKHTERQEAIRTILSVMTEYWNSSMNDGERELWNVYAAGVSWLNRIGETVHVTGFNMFCRTNAVVITCGGALSKVAPTILSLPTKDTTMHIGGTSIANQTITYHFSTAGWTGPNPKMGIAVYQGLPQLSSRNFFNGHWRFQKFFEGPGGTPGIVIVEAVFPFALGQKLFIKARLLDSDHRVSEQWQLTPYVVPVDA